MLEVISPQSTIEPFEIAVHAVMAELRDALVAMMVALPEMPHRAVDLERALSVDKKLAWQVFRLSGSTGLSQLLNVPPRVSQRRVIEAARKKGVPGEVLERVSRAFEAFEKFVATHGDDREALLSMVTGIGDDLGEENEQHELKMRKAQFRTNAHVWGVQADMVVRTSITVPRPGTDRIEDCAALAGDIGVQRRRAGEPFTMRSALSLITEIQKPDVSSTAPEAKALFEMELLREFSSSPLPEMRRKPPVYGVPETELWFPPGRSGAISLYSAYFRENMSIPGGEQFGGQTLYTVPARQAVWEMLIPVGWSDPTRTWARVYGRRLRPELVVERRPEDLLPQRETLNHLGVHSGVPPLTGSPRHAEAVRSVLARHGWQGMKFDVYRCRVEYPAMFTMLAVLVDAVPQ